jgi:hypothetical protein
VFVEVFVLFRCDTNLLLAHIHHNFPNAVLFILFLFDYLVWLFPTQIQFQSLFVFLEVIEDELTPRLKFLHNSPEVLGFLEFYADSLGDIVKAVDITVR